MQQQWLGNTVNAMDSLLADDAVIEPRSPRQAGHGGSAGERSSWRGQLPALLPSTSTAAGK